jgi:uncharacterized protein YjbI with pentapeptide repeats
MMFNNRLFDGTGFDGTGFVGVLNGYSIAPNAQLEGANLSGADLRAANLTGANLKGADLSGAFLEQAKLGGAILEDAVLKNTMLDGAVLVGANLKNANLSWAEGAAVDFTEALLHKAIMWGVKLGHSIFKDADLTRADLWRAQLSRARFHDADLRKAVIKYAYMNSAFFNGAKLTGAYFECVELIGTVFDDAIIHDVDFSSSLLEETQFVHADLRGSKLGGSTSTLNGVNFTGAKLQEADFNEAVLRVCNFSEADMQGTKLQWAFLERCDFRKSDLRGAKFQDSLLNNNEWRGAKVQGASFEGTSGMRAFAGGSMGPLIWSQGFEEAEGLEDAIFSPRIFTSAHQKARSYGEMTGAVLKMLKPDAPVKASDFKKKYPAEFERLKGVTSGRDFSEDIKEKIKHQYLTPFDWQTSNSFYGRDARALRDSWNDKAWDAGDQQYSRKPNSVLKLDINTSQFSESEARILGLLSKVAESSNHPYSRGDFFNIGWVRYTIDHAHATIMIEEVQSDLYSYKTLLKERNKRLNAVLTAFNLSVEDIETALEITKGYLERFPEDAIGFIFKKAAELGYTVEMLGYKDKKVFGSPRSVYIDLPRRVGMTKTRQSEVPTRFRMTDRVSFYNPNPSKPKRWRK